MKPRPFLHCSLLLLALGAVAGCDTIASRIQEKPALFAQLDPVVQQGIQHGRIGVGFTPEMVYLALGRPTTIETAADGSDTVWTYFSYNTPEGSFMLDSKGGTHNPTNSVGLLIDGSFQTVAGKADLDNGEVKVPDELTRRKTAMEMVQDDSPRQDLKVRFADGKAVACEIVRI